MRVLKKISQNVVLRQSILLLSSTILSMFSLIIINFFLTHLLTPELFGNYSFLINIFTFSQIVFNFGFFQSICRLIAVSNDKRRNRELYSIGLIILFFLSILMFLSLLVYAFTSQHIKDNNLFYTFLLILPFGGVYLLTNFNELILQSDNKIFLLSISRLFPRILFVLILFTLFILEIGNNLNLILVLYFCSYLIIYLYIIYCLKPKFSNIKQRFIEVWRANCQYGFHIYIGALFAVGVSNLIGILISYFEKSNIPVGYYNIALQLSAPLALIPNVVATVSFKKFAQQDKINIKVVFFMLIVSISILALILLLARPLVGIVYGESYLESVELIKFLSIGSLLYGVADFYNRFLLSKGKGAELRNASIIVGAILLIASLLFIYLFGVKGAAYSKIIAGISYILVMIYFYGKVVRTNTVM